MKGVNGQTSYDTEILQTTIHCANSHLEGTFLVMLTREVEENVLLGRTWMVETTSTINWGANIMAFSFGPTRSRCAHCSRSQGTTPKLLEELFSPKHRPQLTPRLTP